MKSLREFINEAFDEDEIELAFDNVVSSDGYDSDSQRKRDLKAMSKGGNDMLVDDVINKLEVEYKWSSNDTTKYHDQIADKCQELAKMYLKNNW